MAPASGTDPVAVDTVAAVEAFVAGREIDFEDPGWRLDLAKPPVFPFDPDSRIIWVLETSEGPIRFELYPDLAPAHVSSLLYLTRLGFYDGLIFHRIISGFMAQGGDPLGNGLGGPGYTVPPELSNTRRGRHGRRGVLSAANRGPGTDGSQFFVLFGAQSSLDGKHTVFGQMLEGKDVLRRIGKHGTSKGKPKKLVVIESVSFHVE